MGKRDFYNFGHLLTWVIGYYFLVLYPNSAINNFVRYGAITFELSRIFYIIKDKSFYDKENVGLPSYHFKPQQILTSIIIIVVLFFIE